MSATKRASEGNWLAGKELLLQHGFKPAAQTPPSFIDDAVKTVLSFC